MSKPLMTFLRDSAAAAVLAALFFLWVSSFFSAWKGHAVSVRSTRDATPSAYQVLIVTESDRMLEVDWPAEIVEGRALPINDRAVPPADIPEDAPFTTKSRFALSFFVENEEGRTDRVATTSPRSLGLSFIVWFLLVALRNMLTSGNPMSIEPRDRIIPTGQTSSGQVAPPKQVSRKTRPEPRRRKRRR